MGTMIQDVRYALRILAKSPGFTIIAVLTLALGIGANTAMFSVVNSVLLGALPFRDANRLVAVNETHPRVPEMGAPSADLRDWKLQSRSFDALAAYTAPGFWNAALTGSGDPEEIHGSIASHDFFPVLGITPALGRNFLAQEDEPGHGPVAVLSGRLWKSRFGANPRILGQTVVLDGKSYAVVGVLAPGEGFPPQVDVWVPLSNLDHDDLTSRYYHPLFVIGRLRPGVSVAHASAELSGIAARLAEAYPATNAGIGVAVQPLRAKYEGGLSRSLAILWGAVALILLIACANVASLLLARGVTREPEIAVRNALGATRARLIRQSLTESLVLAALGGAAGIVLAVAALPLLVQAIPRIADVPMLQLHQIQLDVRVLLITLAIVAAAGVLFGLLPALRMSGRPAGAAIRAAAWSSPAGNRRSAQRILVVTEIALAVIVLAAAALLLRSLQELVATSPGFRTDHLLTMRIALPANRYNPAGHQIPDFYQRLLPSVRSLPGVENAATISETPLIPNTSLTRFLVDGAPPVRPGDYPVAHFRMVSPDYFQAMGIPLLKGRFLGEADLSAPAPGFVVINRTLAHAYFPGQSPVGHKIVLGVATGNRSAVPIAGVVGDVRDLAIASPAPPEMYFAGFTQVETLAVHTALGPTSAFGAIRSAIRAVDPEQPVSEVRTGTELMGDSMARERFSALLLGAFGVLALVLAMTGVYGVTAYGVTQRTREIGLRIALGAQRRDVFWLVLRESLVLAGAGLAVGLVAALWSARLLHGMLYGVRAADPMMLAVTAFALSCAVVVAAYVPARRAMRVDPMVALRHE